MEAALFFCGGLLLTLGFIFPVIDMISLRGLLHFFLWFFLLTSGALLIGAAWFVHDKE